MGSQISVPIGVGDYAMKGMKKAQPDKIGQADFS